MAHAVNKATMTFELNCLSMIPRNATPKPRCLSTPSLTLSDVVSDRRPQFLNRRIDSALLPACAFSSSRSFSSSLIARRVRMTRCAKNKIHRAPVPAAQKHNLSGVRLLDHTGRDRAFEHQGDEVSEGQPCVRAGKVLTGDRHADHRRRFRLFLRGLRPSHHWEMPSSSLRPIQSMIWGYMPPKARARAGGRKTRDGASNT